MPNFDPYFDRRIQCFLPFLYPLLLSFSSAKNWDINWSRIDGGQRVLLREAPAFSWRAIREYPLETDDLRRLFWLSPVQRKRNTRRFAYQPSGKDHSASAKISIRSPLTFFCDSFLNQHLYKSKHIALWKFMFQGVEVIASLEPDEWSISRVCFRLACSFSWGQRERLFKGCQTIPWPDPQVWEETNLLWVNPRGQRTAQPNFFKFWTINWKKLWYLKIPKGYFF